MHFQRLGLKPCTDIDTDSAGSGQHHLVPDLVYGGHYHRIRLQLVGETGPGQRLHRPCSWSAATLHRRNKAANGA
jgi:hypothetical protein